MFIFLWRILGIISLACLAAVIHRSFIEDEPEVTFVRPVAKTHMATVQQTTPSATLTSEAPTPTPQAEVVTLITADKAHELYTEAPAQFIDARSQKAFRQGHLPLAVNLPLSSFSQGFPAVLDDLIPEVTTMVYCEGGECESSRLVARQLVMAGFESVMVIEDGYPGWIAGDYPIDAEDGEEP